MTDSAKPDILALARQIEQSVRARRDTEPLRSRLALQVREKLPGVFGASEERALYRTVLRVAGGTSDASV